MASVFDKDAAGMLLTSSTPSCAVRTYGDDDLDRTAFLIMMDRPLYLAHDEVVLP